MAKSSDHFLQYILGKVIAYIYWILCLTWRYKVFYHDGLENVDFSKSPSKPYVMSHWHRDDIAMIGFCRRKKFMTLVSDSKDGTLMASALESVGFNVKRGSSSRGGIKGMLALIKELESDPYYVSLAVDGPRGPIYKAKRGIYFLGTKTDSIAAHCVAKCETKWILQKTWMKTYIPKPFSTVELHFHLLPDPKKMEEKEFLNHIETLL